MTDLAQKARTLLDLHTAPEILTLANVWDVVSAQVVAAVPGVRALATASHSIASTFGYKDGENIPLDLHLDMVRRIVWDIRLPRTLGAWCAGALLGLGGAVAQGKGFLDGKEMASAFRLLRYRTTGDARDPEDVRNSYELLSAISRNPPPPLPPPGPDAGGGGELIVELT